MSGHAFLCGLCIRLRSLLVNCRQIEPFSIRDSRSQRSYVSWGHISDDLRDKTACEAVRILLVHPIAEHISDVMHEKCDGYKVT